MKPLIFLKSGVKPEFTFEFNWLLTNCWYTWREHGLGDFIITSGKDGLHQAGSLHYVGNAADISTREFFMEETGQHEPLIKEYRSVIAQKFGEFGLGTFLHPDDGGGVPHLHLSYIARKGRPWEPAR